LFATGQDRPSFTNPVIDQTDPARIGALAFELLRDAARIGENGGHQRMKAPLDNTTEFLRLLAPQF
jgi:hypothetical protein